MLKISIEVEAPSDGEAQNIVEYIAHQIGQGYTSGVGYDVTGEPEEDEEE